MESSVARRSVRSRRQAVQFSPPSFRKKRKKALPSRKVDPDIYRGNKDETSKKTLSFFPVRRYRRNVAERGLSAGEDCNVISHAYDSFTHDGQPGKVGGKSERSFFFFSPWVDLRSVSGRKKNWLRENACCAVQVSTCAPWTSSSSAPSS